MILSFSFLCKAILFYIFKNNDIMEYSNKIRTYVLKGIAGFKMTHNYLV